MARRDETGSATIAGGRTERQDHPVAEDLAAAVGAMTPDRVDEVLAEMAAAVPAIRDDHQAAEQAAEAAEAAAEACRDRVGPFGDDPIQVRPGYALLVHQEEATQAAEGRLQVAYEELAAWWAYAATLALLSEVRRAPVTEAAIAATGPWHFLSADELADLARSKGLPDLPRHLEPEDWRRIQWGLAWQRHRLPALPTAADLAVELTRASVPAVAVIDVTNALGAVEAAVQAHDTLAALEEDEPPLPGHDEIARLAEGRPTADLAALRHAQWNLYLGRTDRVVDYAAAVSRQLPTIRATISSTAASGR